MERTGVQARSPEELKKTINSLKEASKITAKIIKEKDNQIKKINAENNLLLYKLKVITSKYKKLLEETKKNNEV